MDNAEKAEMALATLQPAISQERRQYATRRAGRLRIQIAALEARVQAAKPYSDLKSDLQMSLRSKKQALKRWEEILS